MSVQENETAIRAIIEARAAAVRAGDVNAMMADVADDIVTFDVVDPLKDLGADSARKRAAQWMASYNGSIGWDSRDTQITTDGNVAFSHELSHVTGKLKTGAEVNMWFRTTLGFQRINGRWLVVHNHSSDPFDPESGKASLGLHP